MTWGVDVSQVTFAFGRIESALNYILSHLNELSGLAAQAERLDALLSGIRTTNLHIVEPSDLPPNDARP